jgi:hypothetical protein
MVKAINLALNGSNINLSKFLCFLLLGSHFAKAQLEVVPNNVQTVSKNLVISRN